MKKLLITTLLITTFLFFQETKAQVRFNLNVHVGNRPDWGLAGNETGNYYYLPEINCYYDLMNRQFIYFEDGHWLFANTLPYTYRNYDFYNGYKVMVNEYRPYLHNDFYMNRYGGHINMYRQPPVYVQRRDDDRYNYRYNAPRYNDRDRDDYRFENNRDRDDRRFENYRNNNDRFERGNDRDHRNGRGRG